MPAACRACCQMCAWAGFGARARRTTSRACGLSAVISLLLGASRSSIVVWKHPPGRSRREEAGGLPVASRRRSVIIGDGRGDGSPLRSRDYTTRGDIMRRLLGLALLAGVAWARLTAPAPAAEEKAPGKIRVLIIDGQNNHNWRATTPLMKKELEDTGRFVVDVATTPPKPPAPPKPKDPKDEAAQAKYKEALAQQADEQKKYQAAMATFHPDVTRYDVVLSNYNGDPWPTALQKDLEEAVGSGKAGLVIVHAA